MNFSGILVGAAVFLAIGIFHPLVIKLEYEIGRKGWWTLLVAGLVFLGASLCVKGLLLSTILGAFAFSAFWSIHEMFLQEKRVLRGWFPENPKRHAYYEEKRKSFRV